LKRFFSEIIPKQRRLTMTKINRRSVLAGAGALSSLALPKYLRAQNAPIRIGAIFPLSGPIVDNGAGWLLGVQIAVEQWNRKGGLLGRQIELVVRDDKYTSSGAVAASRELAGMGVNLLVAAAQTQMALGMAPLLEELNAVCASPGSTGMSLTHENFSPNFFRLIDNSFLYYGGLGNIGFDRAPDAKNFAMITMDTEAGRDSATYFQYGAQQAAAVINRKIEFQETIFAPATQKDFKVEINKLMNSPAEVLFIGMPSSGNISLLQQARAVGYLNKLKVICDMGMDLQGGQAMQKSTPTNLWSHGFWYPQYEPFKSNPISQELYQDYIRIKKDRYPIGTCSTSHRASLALFNAIKKASATDTKSVIAALKGLTFDTACGPYAIRKEDNQGIGLTVYGKIGPRNEEPFYGVDGIVLRDESKFVEPPTPGKKFVLPT
jgi:branched-chain amino acid transport system substrate-binding protein